jgi:hypothetical protein
MCKDCVRQHQKIFDTAEWYDYLIVFFSAAVLSAIGSALAMIVTSIIWGIFVIGLGPVAGITLANITRRFVRNHRSPMLNATLVVGMIAGALPMLIFSGLPALLIMFWGGADIMTAAFSFSPLLWQVVYLVTSVPAAYSQFSGLFFRR